MQRVQLLWSLLKDFQEHRGRMERLQRPQDWRGDTEGNKGHFIAWQTLVPHKAAQLALVKRSSQGRTPEPGEAASPVSSAGCTGQVGAVGSRGQHGSWTAGLVRCRARLSCITGHSRTAAGQGARSMGPEAGLPALCFFRCPQHLGLDLSPLFFDCHFHGFKQKPRDSVVCEHLSREEGREESGNSNRRCQSST